jgi:hypothetical protein
LRGIAREPAVAAESRRRQKPPRAPERRDGLVGVAESRAGEERKAPWPPVVGELKGRDLRVPVNEMRTRGAPNVM